MNNNRQFSLPLWNQIYLLYNDTCSLQWWFQHFFDVAQAGHIQPNLRENLQGNSDYKIFTLYLCIQKLKRKNCNIFQSILIRKVFHNQFTESTALLSAGELELGEPNKVCNLWSSSRVILTVVSLVSAPFPFFEVFFPSFFLVKNK